MRLGSESCPRPSDAPDWIDSPRLADCDSIGSTANCAQVHPFKLTHAYLHASKATVLLAEVTSVQANAADEQYTVSLREADTDQQLVVDAVVLAMGPWTASAANWFADSAVQRALRSVGGQRAESIVLEADVGAHALFIEAADGPSSPEIYPRPDGTGWSLHRSTRCFSLCAPSFFRRHLTLTLTQCTFAAALTTTYRCHAIPVLNRCPMLRHACKRWLAGFARRWAPRRWFARRRATCRWPENSC